MKTPSYIIGLSVGILTLSLMGCQQSTTTTTAPQTQTPTTTATQTAQTTEETKEGILAAHPEDADAAYLNMANGTTILLVAQNGNVHFSGLIGQKVTVKGKISYPPNPTANDQSEFDVSEITTTQATDSKLYTDKKSGLSFMNPTGWTVSTDENGNLYTYKENPYLTVTFITFADKASWQKRMADLQGPDNSDKLAQKENIKIGELPTISLVYDRNKELQYGEYFVDGGTKWYEISTADPTSKDIIAILQSVKF